MACMPELPEVETVARQLAPRLVGRRVRRLEIYDALLRKAAAPRVAGRRVEEVTRSGKRVLLRFSGARSSRGPLWLAVHLRMTGRLIWSASVERRTRPHLRAQVKLDRGSLLFVDMRRFGTFSWFRSREASDPEGVDPLSRDLTPSGMARLVRGSRQEIKPWLLRQDRLVGLGNIYASEILHRARISPLREAGSLDPREARRLHTSMVRILTRAIERCGTTFSDFLDARGVEGEYAQFLTVYSRQGEPCGRCKAPIQRIVQQQRSTFWCSDCQL